MIELVRHDQTVGSGIIFNRIGYFAIVQHPKCRKGSYEHKNQVEFYKNVERVMRVVLLEKKIQKKCTQCLNIFVKDTDFNQKRWMLWHY